MTALAGPPVGFGDARDLLAAVGAAEAGSARAPVPLAIAAFRLPVEGDHHTWHEFVARIRAQTEAMLAALTPRSVVLVLDGTGREEWRGLGRLAATLIDGISSVASNSVGADTTAVAVTLGPRGQRPVVALRLRQLGGRPLRVGGGTVLAAADLYRAGIRRLIVENAL